MARRGSDKVAFFLLGGYDLLGDLTQFDDTHTALIERTDTLGDQFEEYEFVGVRGGEITQDGFFNTDALTGHGAITTGPGVARQLVYGIAGTATGAEFVGYSSAVEVSFSELVSRGELHKAKATYRTNGPIDTGKVVATYKAPGATGKSPLLDLGAAATGLGAYFQWNAAAGETNVRLMHSASNGATAGAELFVFTKTDATNSRGTERQTTTGTVQRYVWFDVTTATATGSIADFKYFGGIVRSLST